MSHGDQGSAIGVQGPAGGYARRALFVSLPGAGRLHLAAGLAVLVALVLLAPAPLLADDLPAGWTVELLKDFDRAGAVSVPPAGLWRGQMSDLKVTQAKDVRVAGSSVLWQVTAAQAAQQAALVVATEQELQHTSAVAAFALWVKNPAEHQLELGLRATDAEGVTWRCAPVALGGHKGWFQYLFHLQPGAADSQPAALPYRTVELLLSGMPPGQRCSLYFDELRGLAPPPAEVRLSGLVAATEATAGQSLPVRISAQVTGAGTSRPLVEARLSHGSTLACFATAAVGAVTPSPQAVDLVLPIPAHLAAGPYKLSFGVRAARLAAAPEQDLNVAGQPVFRHTAVTPPQKGGGFAVDGVALPPIGGWLRGKSLPLQAPWVMFACTSDYDATGQSAAVWLAPDKFDYGELDARIATILSANPDAYLIPVVSLGSPPWWDAAHPKELMVFGDGKPLLPEAAANGKRTCASFASAVWRKEAAAALTRLIRHLEDGPFAPAIIGYQLAGGELGRWAYPGTSAGAFADYSGPQQEAFRAWLKDKYKDVKSLRMAWGQPALPVNTAEARREVPVIMGFGEVRVPDQAQRVRGPSGVLHDPNAAQEIIDYQIFCSDLVGETIRHFCGAARSAAGDRKLIGAAYGHLFDLAATRYGVQNGGHLALAPMCQGKDLDFLVTNATCAEQGGAPLLTTAHSSVLAHEKAWVTMAAAGDGASGLVSGLCGGGAVALEGYDPRRLPPLLRTLPPQLGRASVAEIAVIVDDISAAYTNCGPELVKPLLADQRLSLSLLGAPMDVWTLDDVMERRVTGYKLYIFLDCFYLDAQWRKELVEILGEQHPSVLWVYAPGAIDANIGGRTMTALTGMTLVPWVQRRTEGAAPGARVEKGLLQVRVGGEGGYSYGSPLSLAPRFVCVDDNADVRGTLAGTALGGLAVKEVGPIKSVWSGAPHVPASLLRAIAGDADVHMYSDDGDGVYTSETLIALRAARDGEHVVRLPRLAQVYDLTDGKPLGAPATEFRVRLRAGQVGLYYYGSAPLVAR